MKNVFIIGSRGYTQNYGGWETFVHGLIDNWKDSSVCFYVFGLSNEKEENGKVKEVNGVKCISIYVKQTGSIAMVLCDYYATKIALDFVKKNRIENPIFFYLGLRIGPYIRAIKKRFVKSGIILLENPAGIEWKRTKWNRLVQIYTKFAAKSMAKSVDYLVCDNGGILDEYNAFKCCKKTKKIVIPYGTYSASQTEEILPKEVFEYYNKYNISPNEYYLILGRLVPENNYDLMISEISNYQGSKKFLIICNVSKESKYFNKLKNSFKLENKQNIIFPGELYEKNMLSYIRQNAFGYIHGHSVGGTNPGLLEAMSNTNICILYDCVFNKEVGKDTALYFSNKRGSLLAALANAEMMTQKEIEQLGARAKENMKHNYSWDLIVRQYERLFDGLKK